MRKRLLTVFILLTILIPIAAQKENDIPPEATVQIEEPMRTDTDIHIDTLSARDRMGIRTNVADWLMQIPNVGIEFALGNTTYHRNTIGLTLRYNWQTSHTYKPGLVYNIAEARLDFRNYFRVKVIDPQGKEWTTVPHKHLWDKPFSARHKKSKHPNTVFYRGAYLAYTKFSFLFGSEGMQGSAIGAGYQFGMVKPLYVFRNGHSLDLDLGAALGVIYASYDKYRLDRTSDCYPKTGRADGKILPMLNELRCALVYRLGKTPVTRRYRWRYDVDMDYRDKKDSIYYANVKRREDLRNTDSIQSLIRKEFWAVYDSLKTIENAQADTIKMNKVREQKALAEQQKALKEARKRKPAVPVTPEGQPAEGTAAGEEGGTEENTGETPDGGNEAVTAPDNGETTGEAPEGQPAEGGEAAAETPDGGNEAATAPDAAAETPEGQSAEAGKEEEEMKEDNAKDNRQPEDTRPEETPSATEQPADGEQTPAGQENEGEQKPAETDGADDGTSATAAEEGKEDGQ